MSRFGQTVDPVGHPRQPCREDVEQRCASEPSELIAQMRALCRRTTAQTRQPMLIHGDIEQDVRARPAHRAGRHLRLSPKESELLKYLMEIAGEIVTREMLLRDIWKLNFDPQTNVIEVNLVRLRRKLEDGFGPSCLETVRGHGYRLTPPPCSRDAPPSPRLRSGRRCCRCC